MGANRGMTPVIVEEDDFATSSYDVGNEHAKSNAHHISESLDCESAGIDEQKERKDAENAYYTEMGGPSSQLLCHDLGNELRRSNVDSLNEAGALRNESQATGSMNSPSCYKAVIAAASTNLYRSSHCSTY